MRDNDCGAIPLTEADSDEIVGIVTDRDLVVRGLAEHQPGSAPVSLFMTPSPASCSASDDLRDVERIMTDKQVRRVPVVDASGRCVGIISQADIALAAGAKGEVTDHEVAIVVERISEPRSDRERELTFESEQYLGG